MVILIAVCGIYTIMVILIAVCGIYTEPDDCTGVVHWWQVHAAAGTYTHLARYGVRSVQSVRWAMCTRSLLRGGRYNALRICNCKMCLTSSLCARAFPTMLQIPALDHTTSICVFWVLVSFALLLAFVFF